MWWLVFTTWAILVGMFTALNIRLDRLREELRQHLRESYYYDTERDEYMKREQC